MTITSMGELFGHGLEDLYYAENQVSKALGELAGSASASGLKMVLLSHKERSAAHISRLEQVFALLQRPAKGVTCPAILGLIEEAQEVVGEIETSPLRDAAIVASAVAIQAYEEKRYATLMDWAGQLRAEAPDRWRQIGALLETTLSEERAQARELVRISADQVLAVAA